MSAIIPQTVLALKGFSLVLENSAHCLPQGAGGDPFCLPQGATKTTGGPGAPRLGPYGGTLWNSPPMAGILVAKAGTLWWDLMELTSNGGNSDNHIDYRARFETESEPRLILIRRLLNLTAVHTVHTPAMHCRALLCILF